MDTKQLLIAGEPVDNLIAGLRQFRLTRRRNGNYDLDAELDGEIAASWIRAIERYGADFVQAGQLGDREQRHVDALVKIVGELDDLLAEDGPT